MEKTVSMISLGCPRNLVDSENILSGFKKKGYRLVRGNLKSEILIINTCAFIEDAKIESIGAILKAIDAKKEGHVKKLIVAGCLSERYKYELAKELKEVDEFMGVLAFKKADDGNLKLTPNYYSYIKISEGCANRCAYCIIPYLKGDYKSKPIGSIKNEAIGLIKKGAKELILIGQDTSLYGIDLYGKKRLADLLKELAGISKDTWIRLLYLHPAHLDKETISVLKDNENICKYIDLPLEHINDRILRQMARPANREKIKKLIDYIRKEIPGACIRTSFIVGFPGETDKEFKQLVSFIKEMRFERLGVFKYSREEGTPAYDYKNQISEKEKAERFNALMSAQKDISKKINERFKGTIMKVLIEEKSQGFYLGRTEYDAPEIDGAVYIKSKNLKIGDFYNVKITDTYEYDLVGELA